MIFHMILGVLGLLLFCFTVFMLSYYDWRSAAIRRRYLQIPHPELTLITGVGLELVKYSLDEVLNCTEKWWKSLGDVLYLPLMGIPNVMIVNPKDIEVLYSNIKYVNKGVEYRLFRSWVGNGLITGSGDHWHTRRMQLTPSFHHKILEKYLPIFKEHAKNLIEELAGTGGQPMSIEPFILSCALNIICKTTMETSLDVMQKNAKEYANSIAV